MSYNINPSEPVVQHQIGTSDSVTVPTDEVWKVTISCPSFSAAGDEGAFVVEIDGNSVVGSGAMPLFDNDAGGATNSTAPTEAVLVGGQQITFSENTTGYVDTYGSPSALISGRKISDAVANTPVSKVISDGQTVTVPSSEEWLTTVSAPPMVSYDSNAQYYDVALNGDTISSSTHNDNMGGVSSTFPHKASFVGGDTIEFSQSEYGEAYPAAALVSGFVINE